MATAKADGGAASTSTRLVVALLGALVLWLVIAVTLAQKQALALPAIVPGFLGIDGANGMRPLAAAIAGEGAKSAKAAAARATAIRTLRFEPTNVAAARTLALVDAFSGQTARSLAALNYAEKLSRRDAPTELTLMELYVQRGDIDGALLRYDRAMRTSLPSRGMLIPVLAAATADPTIARAIRPLLARRPNWFYDYLSVAVRTASNPQGLFLQTSGAGLNAAVDADRSLLSEAMSHLLRLGRPDLAWRLYAGAAGGPVSRDGVRNGGFENVRMMPPFDWTLAEAPDLSPAIEPVEAARGSALTLSATKGAELATQTLLLRPGRYRLMARVGEISSDPMARPLVAVRCLSGTSIVERPLPNQGVLDLRFDVPGEKCDGQALSLSSGISPDAQLRPWIDDVQIVADQTR